MVVEVANGGKSMACYEGGMSTIIQQMMQYQSVVEYVGASLVNTCARTNSHKYERERERESLVVSYGNIQSDRQAYGEIAHKTQIGRHTMLAIQWAPPSI